MGHLASDPSNELTVYCVDFSADFESPAAVTVNTIATIDDTRYGSDPTCNFTFFNGTTASDSLWTGGGTAPTLTVEQRYVLAAYLTTQYNFSTTNPSQDDSIQSAIWDLLNVSGADFTTGGNVSYWIQQADAWYTAPSTNLAGFESEITIYTPTYLSGPNDSQEMIGVAPEPETLAMFGVGLLAIGLLKKRRKSER